jgi:hypothetical protein
MKRKAEKRRVNTKNSFVSLLLSFLSLNEKMAKVESETAMPRCGKKLRVIIRYEKTNERRQISR